MFYGSYVVMWHVIKAYDVGKASHSRGLHKALHRGTDCTVFLILCETGKFNNCRRLLYA